MQAITVFDPATEEQIGEIPDGGAEAVNQAVARARAAFNAGAWHEKPPGERARIIWRIADLLEQNADELAAIDSRNVGMSRNHARNLAFAAADMVRYFSGWCTKIYGQAADLKMAGESQVNRPVCTATRSRNRSAWQARSCPGMGLSIMRSPNSPRH